MVASVDTSHDAFVRARGVVIGFAVAAIVLALVLGFAISWSLVGAVSAMDTSLAQIASGDFIFEIHPVRAVTVGGKVLTFDVDIPAQDAIHTWTDPHPVAKQDERVRVTYAKSTDTLVFSDMVGRDENYIRVSGAVSDVRTTVTGEALPSFTLTSSEVGHPLRAYCLPGTSAARQLQRLATSTVSAVILRNIDLTEALKGQYVINVLAIDLQAA